MEKDDLFDFGLKIDELKRELENINSELSDIKSELSDVKNVIHSELSDIKNVIHSELSDIKNEIPDISKLENLHKRTNEIFDRIESGTFVIKVFGWIFIGFGIISLLRGCFGL